MKRLLLTLSAPILVALGARVPLPGLDLDRLPPTLHGMPQLGVLALGLVPALTAFVLVELAALAVPRWRTLRIAGPGERRALLRSTLMVALVLTLVQSFFLLRWAQGLGLAGGGTDGVLVMLSLMAGVFALIGLARLVDRQGLASGFAVLLAGGAVAGAIDGAGRLWLMAETEPTRLLSYLATLAAIAATTWFVLTEPQRRARRDEVQLRLPSSGIAPLSAAAALLMLPITFYNLGLAIEPVVRVLVPGSSLYFGCELALILGGSFLFTRWFNSPARVADATERLGGEPLDRAALAAHVASLGRTAALRSAAWLAALALGVQVAGRIVQGAIVRDSVRIVVEPALGLGAELLLGVLVTAVLLDLVGEHRFRRGRGQLVALWPLSQVYAVDPALDALRAAGIDAYPKNLHVRTLFQFFAPWAPIELLIPVEQCPAAADLLQSRYGAATR